MPLCSSCGTNNAAGNRFCSSCGGSLAEKAASCPKCGVSAVPGNKFCLSCGTSLVAAAVQPLQASAVQPVEAPAVPPSETTLPVKAVAVAAPVAQALPDAAPTIAAEQPVAATIQSCSSGPEPPQSQKPVCTACGADIAPSQKFCLACGTSVGLTTKAAEPPAASDESPVFTAAPALSRDQYQESPFPTAARSGSKLWIIVVVLVAVMGVAGWYAWKYFAGPDVTITTFQKRIHVAAGGKTSLQASVTGSNDTDVNWTIQEGNKGGRIISLGSVTEQNQSHASAAYIAPQASGTFHVIAASHANPNRTAKIEIVVGSTAQPDSTVVPTPAPPAAVTANAAASRIVGRWRGPSSDMTTIMGADSSITMTSEASPQKNLNGRYHFTDDSHLEIDFGNGDIRTWEIIAVDNAYLRVNSQSKDGASAMVFAKISN